GDDDDGPRRSQLRDRNDLKTLGLDDRDRRAVGHVADPLAVHGALQISGRSELKPDALVVDEPLGLPALERAFVEELARRRLRSHAEPAVATVGVEDEPGLLLAGRGRSDRLLLGRRAGRARGRVDDRRDPRGGFGPRAELPRDHDEDRHGDDPRQGDDDEVRLDRARAGGLFLRPGRRERLFFPGEAGVELVDVELAVEAQVPRVRSQEAVDVCLAGQDLEALFLERPQVLRADLGVRFYAGELITLAQPSFTTAVDHLEHGDLDCSAGGLSPYREARVSTANTPSARAPVIASRSANPPRMRAAAASPRPPMRPSDRAFSSRARRAIRNEKNASTKPMGTAGIAW